MSGKTEQITTTGKNFWDIGNTIKITTYKNFTFKTPIPSGTYTISAEVTSTDVDDDRCLLLFFSNDRTNVGTTLHRNNRSSNTIVFEKDVVDVCLYAGTNMNLSNGDVATFKNIQLEKGSSVTPYEPYTDGKPTPSPDFPQIIEVTPKRIITIDFTDGINHQTVELNCPREFTKWDRLQKIDGVWNWIFQSKKTTFEDAIVKNMVTVKDVKQFNISFEDVENSYSESVARCSTFSPATGYESYTQSGKGEYYMAIWNKFVTFTSKKLDGIFQSKESFQEWLRSSGTYMWHKSNEVVKIPLSQQEQMRLNNLVMYAPNTNITNTGGCSMELTYTVDTKSYVDTKIASVVKTVVETQKALL